MIIEDPNTTKYSVAATLGLRVYFCIMYVCEMHTHREFLAPTVV